MSKQFPSPPAGPRTPQPPRNPAPIPSRPTPPPKPADPKKLAIFFASYVAIVAALLISPMVALFVVFIAASLGLFPDPAASRSRRRGNRGCRRRDGQRQPRLLPEASCGHRVRYRVKDGSTGRDSSPFPDRCPHLDHRKRQAPRSHLRRETAERPDRRSFAHERDRRHRRVRPNLSL